MPLLGAPSGLHGGTRVICNHFKNVLAAIVGEAAGAAECPSAKGTDKYWKLNAEVLLRWRGQPECAGVGGGKSEIPCMCV